MPLNEESDMDFAEFVRRLSTLLRVEFPDDVNPYDSLYADLGLDSFQAFEMLIIIEGLADCMVPPLEVPEIYTLNDAYAYYQHLRDAELAES